MDQSLDDLANKELYKTNPEYVKLFDELDNVCTPKEHNYTCETLKYKDIQESFVPKLEKIFTILKRSITHNKIYLTHISSLKHDPCVYYKYWFYHKIINHNSEEINFSKLNQIWSNNLADIYGLFPPEHCKFFAKNLEDIKILKVIYDHILFFNNAKNEYNFIDNIKKCEFCNHLERYIKKIFKKLPVICTHGSSYAFCVEYNSNLKEIIDLDKLSSLSCESGVNESHCPLYSKLHEQDTKGMESVMGRSGDVTSRTQEDAETSGSTENLEGSNLHVKNIIGGTGIFYKKKVLFIKDEREK
ncbi:PIR Superfamily Protein [Plasmodium ovale wallikeri]|uniref:PIR Superfamily Protein n=1 Tax=Plasmodium ovale wallikeri TaxID=864142 RepID=A0A1A9AN49_PLAOA|nr:PIR Superfamily Protein [Plasmodium ovale wallikeri]